MSWWEISHPWFGESLSVNKIIGPHRFIGLQLERNALRKVDLYRVYEQLPKKVMLLDASIFLSTLAT